MMASNFKHEDGRGYSYHPTRKDAPLSDLAFIRGPFLKKTP